MIRRRTSIQHENIPEIPKQITKEHIAPPVSMISESGAFLLRSETYAYDSSDSSSGSEEEDEVSDLKNFTSRKLTFANTKYLLHSFESGHWSMMGGGIDEEGQIEPSLSPLPCLTSPQRVITMTTLWNRCYRIPPQE
jgi:hypothetical protein